MGILLSFPLIVPVIVLALIVLWLIRVYCFDHSFALSFWWRHEKFDRVPPKGSWKERYPRLRLWTRPLRIQYYRWRFYRDRPRRRRPDAWTDDEFWKYRHPILRRLTRPIRHRRNSDRQDPDHHVPGTS